VLHQGDSIPGFPSVDSFLYLITPLLKQMRDPALELLNNVHLYLESIANQLVDKIFARFPTIIDEINDIVNRALLEEKETTKDLIENVIESERTYIFTNDIDYMTQRTSLIPTDNAKGKDQRPTNPEKLFIDEMRSRIDAYFCIVLRNIRDTIPKILGNFLVKAVQEKMQYTLYNEINKNEQLMNMVGEPPHITAERETLNKVLGVLRKARLVLTKDPDLAPTFKDSIPVQPLRTANKAPSDTTEKSSLGAPSGRPAGPFGQSRPEEDDRRRPVEQPSFTPPVTTATANTNKFPPASNTGPSSFTKTEPFNQPSNTNYPPQNVPVNNPWGGSGASNNPYGGSGAGFNPGGTQPPKMMPNKPNAFAAPTDQKKPPGTGLFG